MVLEFVWRLSMLNITAGFRVEFSLAVIKMNKYRLCTWCFPSCIDFAMAASACFFQSGGTFECARRNAIKTS
jgi:hypothetical protein